MGALRRRLQGRGGLARRVVRGSGAGFLPVELPGDELLHALVHPLLMGLMGLAAHVSKPVSFGVQPLAHLAELLGAGERAAHGPSRQGTGHAQRGEGAHGGGGGEPRSLGLGGGGLRGDGLMQLLLETRLVGSGPRRALLGATIDLHVPSPRGRRAGGEQGPCQGPAPSGSPARVPGGWTGRLGRETQRPDWPKAPACTGAEPVSRSFTATGQRATAAGSTRVLPLDQSRSWKMRASRSCTSSMPFL